MKTTLLTIIIAFSFYTVSAQLKIDTIQSIDQRVLEINKDTAYWVSSFENSAFLDSAFINQPGQGYGRLTGYFRNGKVCKIREFIGIKLLDQFAVTEYYFFDGKLIFVNEQEIVGPDIYIDNTGTIDHRIDAPSFQIQYYFFNDKLIKSVETGTRTTMLLPNAAYFDSMSKEGQLLYSAEKYYAKFSIKFK